MSLLILQSWVLPGCFIWTPGSKNIVCAPIDPHQRLFGLFRVTFSSTISPISIFTTGCVEILLDAVNMASPFRRNINPNTLAELSHKLKRTMMSKIIYYLFKKYFQPLLSLSQYLYFFVFNFY